MRYAERLREREHLTGQPVRVALVGAGQMGSGLAAQIGRLPGLVLAAVADVDLDRARTALGAGGQTDAVDGAGPEGRRAVEAGRAVALQDTAALADLPLDVVVEATGVPDVGAAVALQALLAGQHAIVLNVEADVTVGRYLDAVARSAGLVYSVADGDEPVSAKELVDFAHDLALEVVCAGKGKNNPLDHAATPDSVAETARRRHMNPKMLCSFVDGSKTMIEMAALANATGLPLDVVGMHGVKAEVEELASVLVPEADGGVLSGSGRVDFAFGPAPGVFCVVRSDDDLVAAELTYLSMGEGPYYTLYRPYHLASLEAPRAIARAVLDGEPAIRPLHPVAEVATVAKRDLAPGDVIDGIGGETVYARTYPAEQAGELLPLGLAAGATLTEPVAKGDPVLRSQADAKPSSIAAMRALQDRLLPRPNTTR